MANGAEEDATIAGACLHARRDPGTRPQFLRQPYPATFVHDEQRLARSLQLFTDAGVADSDDTVRDLQPSSSSPPGTWCSSPGSRGQRGDDVRSSVLRQRSGHAAAVTGLRGDTTMWARVASFEGTNVERMRAESNRPPDQLPEGIRGAFGLADAETGRQLFITLFDSREAIEAAEPMFEAMGDQIPEDVRGRRVSKDYYEVMLGVVQFT